VNRLLPALLLLLLLSSTVGGSVQAASPRVVLLAAPTEAKAGNAFGVTVRVRGTSGRLSVVAASPHGTTSAVARRSGRTYRARVTVNGPGEWRLSARLGRRSFALTTIDVRSAGATLVEPFRVALAPDGSLVIPNGRGHDVLRLRDGRFERIAGNGSDGFEADGVAATSTAVGFPIDAAVGPNGDVYVVTAHRVRRIDAATGIISTFAGTGVDHYDGDGGPATAANLDAPVAVAVGPGGDVFIAEARGRIRRVDASTRVISTFAGVGRNASSGDGGPATAAEIDRPHGLSVGPDGTVYVADTYGGRIRRIDPSTGTITSVVSGLTTLPVHVVVAPDGSLIVAEAQGAVVSRIAPNGTRTRVIGTGREGSSGDGGPAVRALVEEPAGTAVAADGTIYVAEVDGRRIRRVAPNGRVTTVGR
jgi:serine/threonine-protein kinase